MDKRINEHGLTRAKKKERMKEIRERERGNNIQNSLKNSLEIEKKIK